MLMLAWVAILAGCAANTQVPEPLMPTPVVVTTGNFDPYEDLPDAEKKTDMRVFYGTNRIPKGSSTDPKYGDGIGSVLHLGEVIVRFGDEGLTWEGLAAASRQAPADVSSTDTYRTPEIPLYLIETQEMAAFDTAAKSGAPAALSDGELRYAAAINRQLAKSQDKQLMLYVHGAKENFYYSAVFTAEVNHFLGRDLVGVGYAWPTHKKIIAYGIGIDVRRARNSVEPLVELIEFLAANTDAEKINIVSWSAGARVVGPALSVLRKRNAELDEQALQEKFRLSAVIFAAGDIPRDEFIEQLPDIHAMSGRLTVYMSDDDGVLQFGQKFMKGGARLGELEADIDPEHESQVVAGLDKLEIINVSYFKEDRGFDITGHRYWYTHSWANSDVLMNVRTGLGPEERGLKPAGLDKMWGLPADYPQRASEAHKKFKQLQPEQEKNQ